MVHRLSHHKHEAFGKSYLTLPLYHFSVNKMANFLFQLTIFFVCICLSYAQSDRDAFTQEHRQVVNPDGSYSYLWQTSNGISAEESGIGGIRAQGSYDFVSSDGIPISLQYVADENVHKNEIFIARLAWFLFCHVLGISTNWRSPPSATRYSATHSTRAWVH